MKLEVGDTFSIYEVYEGSEDGRGPRGNLKGRFVDEKLAKEVKGTHGEVTTYNFIVGRNGSIHELASFGSSRNYTLETVEALIAHDEARRKALSKLDANDRAALKL